MNRWQWLAIGLLPGTLAAQEPDPGQLTPIRVGWELVDFVVLQYDDQYLRLLTSPNLQSAVGGQSPVLHLRFDRIEALQWAALAKQAVARTAGTPQGDSIQILTSALRGNNGPSFITLARSSRRHKDSFVLVVMDQTSSTAGWSALARTNQVNDLLDAMFIAANSRAMLGFQPGTEDVAEPIKGVTDRPPSIRGRHPTLRYPLGERRSGRVWVQYVVNTQGRAEPENIRIILSDGIGFEREVRSALSRAQFDPAVVAKRPVRALVFQVFNFVRE